MSNFGLIMELSNSKLGRYSLLRHKKHREKQGLFLVEGEKCVADVLRQFEPEDIIATDAEAMAWTLGRPDVLQASARQMERLSSLSTPPQVAAVFRLPEALQVPDPLPHDLYLALDGLQDPGNLGTIIRIANWFGIRAIFLSQDCVDPFNTKTIQASMGTFATVNMFKCNLKELLTTHYDRPVYGTLLNGKNIYKTELAQDGFIVMGNEGNGISAEIRELVIHPLLIPPYPADSMHTDSLNVAMATAVTVAEFRRRVY